MPHRAAAAFLSVALAQLVAGGGVNAADPPAPGPLDRPIADLALVDAGAGAPPLLLTLDTVDLPVGTVRVTLLARLTGWAPVTTATIVLFDPRDRAETP